MLGLDPASEVKTLQRKLARLAANPCAAQFGWALAQQRVAARGAVIGFLYADGHVRVYHGRHTLASMKSFMGDVRLESFTNGASESHLERIRVCVFLKHR